MLSNTAKIKSVLFKIHFIIIIFFCTYEYGPNRERLFSKYTYIYLIITSILFFLNSKKIILNFKSKLLNIYLASFVFVCFSSLYNNTLIPGIIFIFGQLLLFINISYSYNIFSSPKKNFSILIAEAIVYLSILSFAIGIIVLLKGTISIGPLSIVPSTFTNMRIQGWYGSANRIGPVFGAAIISLLYLIRGNYNKNKFFIYMSLVISILGLILSGSRGSYISTIIALLFILDFKKVFSRRILLVLIKTLLIATTFYFVISLILGSIGYDKEIISQYLYRPLEKEFDVTKTGSRFEIFTESLDYWIHSSDINNILLGLGRNTLILDLERSTHNGFISVLTGDGVIFFIIFIALLALIIKRSLRTNDLFNMYSRSLLVMIILKNLTNSDWPGVTFTGYLFIFILFIYTNKSYVYKITI